MFVVFLAVHHFLFSTCDLSVYYGLVCFADHSIVEARLCVGTVYLSICQIEYITSIHSRKQELCSFDSQLNSLRLPAYLSACLLVMCQQGNQIEKHLTNSVTWIIDCRGVGRGGGAKGAIAPPPFLEARSKTCNLLV